MRLTKPLLVAMENALNAALAGEFGAGDTTGENQDHYERALAWVHQEQAKRRKPTPNP